MWWGSACQSSQARRSHIMYRTEFAAGHACHKAIKAGCMVQGKWKRKPQYRYTGSGSHSPGAREVEATIRCRPVWKPKPQFRKRPRWERKPQFRYVHVRLELEATIQVQARQDAETTILVHWKRKPHPGTE